MGAKNVSLLGETYAFRQEAFRDKIVNPTSSVLIMCGSYAF